MDKVLNFVSVDFICSGAPVLVAASGIRALDIQNSKLYIQTSIGYGTGWVAQPGNYVQSVAPTSIGVTSVTGLDTDNTDPTQPIVKIAVDGVSITGEGTPADPLVATPLGFTPVPQTRTISTTYPLLGGGDLSGNRTLSIELATAVAGGYLSSSDWVTFNSKQSALGFTPENVANKATDITSPDNTKYPTTLAVSNALASVGTVTSVSVVPANGVSGSVATATTTPAITLTLGAITPTSVAATGNVTGLNLSGTNTGDQTTITGNAGSATILQTGRTLAMTGDVTWNSGTFNGSANVTAASTISNDAVTFAKMQNITTARLLGRGTAATGDVEEIATALGTTGTDLTWAYTAGTLTLNVPSASASARGVVTTGTQTMAGAKTWSGAAVFSSTVNITATTTANPFVITSTNSTGTTFAASITANSGSRGMFVSTNGQAQYAARSSSHTDRELRFQMFSDGNCYFGLQGITGSITSDLVIRTSADSGSNAGAIRFGLMGVNKMAITSAGIAIGSQAGALTATARLHLMAGAAAVSSAPLKFTSGTNLTTAETGAVEYDGSNLFFTRTGTTRETVYMGDFGSAPPTMAGVPVTAYGNNDSTIFLSEPNAWATLMLGGNPYLIPLYEP